jgi:serine/threonine-protein kinase
MGEVYRAEDTNLSREVAIKVLPEQFTKDPQRLARLEREAKLLASLNHPNIAAIYGLEEADGVRFLALELVPGETLQERVAKGPLPVEEALEVCRQIAEGVEAAHEKGVIHRDLKPANVKVTPEGKVKILDFGLAKAFEEETPVTDISQSPTLTEEMTRAGVILGTAAYMSPEQAKGEAVDKRADIFAFGCVLYELLTGKRAFGGQTITETLGAIIHKEPEWAKLPESTPSIIQVLLRQCLQKNPDNRLHAIADFRALSQATISPDEPLSVAQPGQQRWALTVGLVVGAVVAGLAVWLLIQPSSPEQSLKRFVIGPSPPARLSSAVEGLGISLDGRRLIYSASIEGGTNQLYLRSLDDLVDRVIPGTENLVGHAFFSPDGESLGFFSSGKLSKVSLAGGSSITLCNVATPGRRGGWFEDTIFFTGTTVEAGQGLYRVPAVGGEPELLAAPNPDEGETVYRYSEILPGEEVLLFSIDLEGGEVQIAALFLETGEQKLVLENARQAYYLPTGHLIYEQARTGNVMAAPFDPVSVEITGDSVPVVQGVRQGTAQVGYAISDDGTLIYATPGGRVVNLVSVDRQGKSELLTDTERLFDDPAFSPDGNFLSLTVGEATDRDIWIYDLQRRILNPFTFEGVNARADWTPDGEHLTFLRRPVDAGSYNIYSKAADGSGEFEQLTNTESVSSKPSWSSDGTLVYTEGIGDSRDIWVLQPDEGEAQLFQGTQFDERQPSFSPDGQWIAFTSNRSGQDEVYVKRYPSSGGLVPISRDGGSGPIWSPDGGELFYRNGNQIMAVTVQAGPSFKAGEPMVLFEGGFGYGYTDFGVPYDISPDGERFVMLKDVGTQPSQIHVVLNWFEELKRLVPTP